MANRNANRYGVGVLPARLAIALFALLLASAADAQTTRPALPDDGLTQRFAGGGGRVPLSADPLTLALADGSYKTPTEAGDGWEAFGKSEDGSYDVKPGAAASFVVRSDAASVMMLKASGHGLVYVNGEPRPGDPYSYGYLSLPVQLKEGDNTFLFRNSRGPLKAELVAPPADVFLLLDDATLPDVRLGRDETLPCGVVVVNATDAPVTAVPWTSQGKASDLELGEHARIEGAAATVPPMSVRKIGFPVYYDGRGGEEFAVTVGFGEIASARAKLALKVKKPGEMYKRTFLSRIDGSVQYYAVQPHVPAEGDADKKYPIVLSVHGASVEATNQAAAYAPKTWCDVVCPTNRRPFGFDWEDWGRIDAMEVLDDALLHLNSDPRRVYLTGHSMGGHGAWSLGTLFPDRFAAVAPSAGWMSFESYTGAGHGDLFKSDDPLSQIFAAASAVSDTAARIDNLTDRDVYILHGEADDNVPVREAKDAAKLLRDHGIPFAMHLEPGVGHWWDNNQDEPGADCVDWPGIFDTFARTRLPAAAEVRQVEFVTDNPAVSGTRAWVTIEAKLDPLRPAKVSLRYDPRLSRVVGTTENVASLTLPAPLMAGRPTGDWPWPVVARAELDGDSLLEMYGGARTIYRDAGGHWQEEPDAVPSTRPAGPAKDARRAGPFKAAFDRRVTLVYGTAGTAEQTAWAMARARLDAEGFYYRGNGAMRVVADADFDPAADPDGGVILYGNADTVSIWADLLGDCPVKLTNGSAKVGDLFVAGGEDRAALFCYPRPGSEVALVGVVGGTGLAGMKLTDNLPLFVAGVHFPDWAIFGPDALRDGYESADAAGFFGNDWQILPAASAKRAATTRPATQP